MFLISIHIVTMEIPGIESSLVNYLIHYYVANECSSLHCWNQHFFPRLKENSCFSFIVAFQYPINILNVCVYVLSGFSNEIDFVKRAFFYCRESYVSLRRFLVWCYDMFWIWCGNITRKKPSMLWYVSTDTAILGWNLVLLPLSFLWVYQ